MLAHCGYFPKMHLQISGDNRKGEHLHTGKDSSIQYPFLPNCLADDAQRLLNYYFQAYEISLGLDSPTIFPKGPTSEKTKGKRSRRCRIGAFIAGQSRTNLNWLTLVLILYC